MFRYPEELLEKRESHLDTEPAEQKNDVKSTPPSQSLEVLLAPGFECVPIVKDKELCSRDWKRNPKAVEKCSISVLNLFHIDFVYDFISPSRTCGIATPGHLLQSHKFSL